MSSADEVPRWTLYPNCGGEEGPDWTRFADFPAVQNCLQLWRWLFPADAHWLGPITPPTSPWPAAFGPQPMGSAFDWIEKTPGGHAWWKDEDAEAVFRNQSIQSIGPRAEIVRTVHDKAFATETARRLGFEAKPLKGTTAVLDPARLENPAEARQWIQHHVSHWPSWISQFTLKPRLGSSGRGRTGGRREALDHQAIENAWPRLAQRGGAILEPWVDRIHDLSVALHLAPLDTVDGPAVTLLGSLEAITLPSGVPIGHCGEIDSRGRVFSGTPFDEDIREAAVALGQAAQASGYSGPCGVDALTFRAPGLDETPREWLRPVVEFNARYTLGLIAVGLVRRLLGWLKATLALAPGERISFFIGLQPPSAHTQWVEAARTSQGDVVGIELGTPALQRVDGGPGAFFARDRPTLMALLEDAHPNDPGSADLSG